VEKFNDFSRFKNNELRSYFSKRDSKLDYKSPFSSSVLSALTVAILWSLKDNSLINLVEKFWLKILFYPIIILIAYLVIYVFYYFILENINFIVEKYKNTFFITSRKRSEKYYLNKFKFEIVNQISLALSMVSHKSETTEKESRLDEFENKFYTTEAYYHIKDAMLILQNNLLITPFLSKIKDEQYTKISIQRIMELLNLSTNLYFEIRDYWDEQGLKEFYKNELIDLKELIISNKELIN